MTEYLKRCPHCGQEKLVSWENPRRSEFSRRRAGPVQSASGMESWCRECRKAGDRERHTEQRFVHTWRDIVDDFGTQKRYRRCAICRCWMEEAVAFPFKFRGRYDSYCWVCRRARWRRRYAERQAEIRRRRRKPRYTEENPWLPIEPFRDWVEITLRHLDAECDNDTEEGPTSLFAWRCHAFDGVERSEQSWMRALYRWRNESTVVRANDADTVLQALATPQGMQDLWPAWRRAVNDGFERRYGYLSKE